MMKKKNLIRVQVVLITLQVISIFFLFWYGGKFYSYHNLLEYADRMESKEMVIDSFSTRSRNAGYSATAHGYINQEKKSLSLGIIPRHQEKGIGVSLGDTLLVWSAKGISGVKIRKSDEKEFNKKKYERSNRNTIIFVFIPIFIIWVFERIVTKKIKQLKNETK
ncbi:hypothetical protein VOI54_14385 [Tamlana sp. 2201CG12-4]|uniref:hypothetical protein n=1 Tax=Tamlana sp. 2201CG12-4 TaxID=3112582 RepID=UPI002DB86FCE|nr:hypothetical protein [Tamlana sp. 2201CG12-4]MEC3908215.1 hypothetical protein [Tamlana sp. 2201CG12-4]